MLADVGTKSYIVGSTNSLLLQQRDRYSDILINLDEDFVNITSTSLKQALQLSTPDRRWIDFITQTVNETWDEANPSRPKTLGFMGSEEFIRLQFEDYVVSLLAAVKYHNFMLKHANNPKMLLQHIDGDPATDFNLDWVEAWTKTENYRIWDTNTDSHLFDIVEPRHLCAGGLTIDDVSRRVALQVQDLHLDEKLAQGREAAARNWAAARKKGGSMINNFYAELESYREAQRKKAEEAKQTQGQAADQQPASPTVKNDPAGPPTYSEKASSYMGSWATWAGEKRKAFAGRSSGSVGSPTGDGSKSSGWGLGLGRSKSRRDGSSTPTSLRSSMDKETKAQNRMSTSSSIFRNFSSSSEREKAASEELARPGTNHSFSESILGSEESGTVSSPEMTPARPRIDFMTKENGVWNDNNNEDDDDIVASAGHQLP